MREETRLHNPMEHAQMPRETERTYSIGQADTLVKQTKVQPALDDINSVLEYQLKRIDSDLAIMEEALCRIGIPVIPSEVNPNAALLPDSPATTSLNIIRKNLGTLSRQADALSNLVHRLSMLG